MVLPQCVVRFVDVKENNDPTAWLRGSALVSINEVTLRRARLVPGWVTVCGRVNHLGCNQPTQPSTAAGRKTSIGKSAVTLCGWE